MIKKIIRSLIYLGIVLVPVFSVYELLNHFPLLFRFSFSYLFIIKFLKDLFLILIFLLFFIDVLSGKKFTNNLFIWLITLIIFISFIITFSYTDSLLAIIGLRVISPIFLLFIGYNYIDYDVLVRIVKILSIIVILEFGLALFQAFGLPYFGRIVFGLARAFGTFSYPWSFATFICFVLSLRLGLDLSMYRKVMNKTWIFIVISIFCVFLAGSGSGIIVLSVLFLIYILIFSKFNHYLKASFIPFVLIIPLLILINLQFLTGREGIFGSLMSRIIIFNDFFNSLNIKDFIIGKGLGAGSNAAKIFLYINRSNVNNPELYFIADSFYVSIMAQIGILFLLGFICFNIYIFLQSIKNKYQGVNPIILLVIPSMLVAGFANSILELYPINWMIFILYGIFLKSQMKLKKRKYNYSN